MTKILIPVEEQRFAEAQVDFLSKHRFSPDTCFSLLSVIRPVVVQDYGFAYPYTYLESITREEEAYAKDLLSQVEKQLREAYPENVINSVTFLGDPAHEIINLAKEGNYDWIVMGSHGRTGLERFFLGSVSQKVVSNAHCSVTIVRIPRPEKAEASKSASSQAKEPSAVAKG